MHGMQTDEKRTAFIARKKTAGSLHSFSYKMLSFRL